MAGDFGRIGFNDITISAISGSDLSLKTDDGWTRTITVTSTTKITKGGATIAVGDLAVGDQIRFAEEKAADGSYTITAIEVVLPTIAGQVTGINGDTLTVTQPGGATATIHVAAGTTYQVDGATGHAVRHQGRLVRRRRGDPAGRTARSTRPPFIAAPAAAGSRARVARGRAAAMAAPGIPTPALHRREQPS